MIFPTLLRVLCLCFGGLLILLSVPIGLMATIPPLDESMTPLWEMMTIAIGLATVLASGFIYVGLFGERPQSVARHRLVAGVLLVMPIALGTQLLLAHGHPEMRPFGWFFLVPSVIAFVSFAWPGVARPALPFVEISE